MSYRSNVLGAKTVRVKASGAEKNITPRKVSYHLRYLLCNFGAAETQDKDIWNCNKMHVFLQLLSEVMRAIKGKAKVKMGDVLERDEGIKLVVRLSGGVSTIFERFFMVCRVANCSYPATNIE